MFRFTIMIVIAGLWAPCAWAQANWTLDPQVGLVRLTQKSSGLGIRYAADGINRTLGLSVSKRIRSDFRITGSYLFIPLEMETYSFTHAPPAAPSQSGTLARSNLRIHFVSMEVLMPVVNDSRTGRSFSVSLGGGLALMDPGENRQEEGNSDKDVPSALESTIDPTVSAGVGLRVPMVHSIPFELNVKYIFQFCNRGDTLEASYLCSLDSVLDHLSVTAGVKIPVR